jgi:copper chaperone CopZ
MSSTPSSFLLLAPALFLATVHAFAAEQKVTLALGGKMCDLYRPSVEAALKKVPGVTALDFKSVKGSVVVTADASVKPDKLADTVNGVKGEGWYCEGKVK